MRHIIYRRILASLCVILVLAQMIQVAYGVHKKTIETEEAGELVVEKDKLLLWYTDEKLNSYLVEAAADFEEEYDAEVTLQLVTAVDYIEHINTASITADIESPDLFITSSELLEKARLAGLTVENDSFTRKELGEYFPQKALDAATCDDKLVAYPFYFETCFLLYNKGYVEEAPGTIDEILNYADTFEGGTTTEAVENIFKWNVADIFYNFFFIANYVNLGGATGDDKKEVTLSTDEVVRCLQYYQSLNAFFAIDAEAVTTDDVLQEFIDGKTVFTIAKTDAIARLDAAIEAGETYVVPEAEEAEVTEEAEVAEEAEVTEEAEVAEEAEVTEEAEDATAEDSYFYGIAEVPDLSEELETKGLSVTNSVVVNAYSQNRDLSKEFAKYITYEKVDDLYTMANKMPVKMGVEYENPEMKTLLVQYEHSMEITKITDLSTYWIEMEIAFANIWKGLDVSAEIDYVNRVVQSRLTE